MDVSSNSSINYQFIIQRIQKRINQLFHRPLLARGTKVAGLDIARLWTILGHAFSYQAMLLFVFKAQIGLWSALADPLLEIRGTTKNPSDLKLVFEAPKTRKTAPRPSQKTTTPKFRKNDFCEKVIFATPSLRKLRIWSPSVDMSTQKWIKK